MSASVRLWGEQSGHDGQKLVNMAWELVQKWILHPSPGRERIHLYIDGHSLLSRLFHLFLSELDQLHSTCARKLLVDVGNVMRARKPDDLQRMKEAVKEKAEGETKST